jgi:YfiR/HmsC-like
LRRRFARAVTVCFMIRKTLFLAILTTLLACATGISGAASEEYKTKAGYLLNFVEFVEWPSEAFPEVGSPVVIGIVGKDPFGPELDTRQGKTVNGRKLQIKRFKGALEFRGEETPGRRQDNILRKQAAKLAELKSCHILFISSSEKKYLPLILNPLKGASVLTVGETAAFAREGGIICFFDDENRVKLEINLAAAEQARLKISSKLLSMAKVINAGHEDAEK